MPRAPSPGPRSSTPRNSRLNGNNTGVHHRGSGKRGGGGGGAALLGRQAAVKKKQQIRG